MSDVNSPTPADPAATPQPQPAPPVGGTPAYAPPVAPAKKSGVGRKIALAVVLIVAIAAGAFVFQLVKAGLSNVSADGDLKDAAFLYQSPAGDYSAQFPSKPVEASQPQTLGELSVTLKTATVESSKEFYTVQSVEFPPEALEQDFDTMLDNSVAGMTANVPGSTVENVEYSTLSGERSTTGQLLAPNSPPFTFAITVFEGSQYIVLYGGDDKEAAQAFLTSFTFTK